MIQLNRILVPTDFSDYSKPALRYGCEFARRFGAELHLLNSVEDVYPMVPESGMLLVPPEEYLSGLKQTAERRLAAIPEAKLVQGIPIVRHVAVGTPFVEIVRYAKGYEIDLIILGTHGRTGISHMLMGSVAERVVRKAPCPVLTVRPAEHTFVLP
jgi:nucleotide-binding universal stress UspA family protein